MRLEETQRPELIEDLNREQSLIEREQINLQVSLVEWWTTSSTSTTLLFCQSRLAEECEYHKQMTKALIRRIGTFRRANPLKNKGKVNKFPTCWTGMEVFSLSGSSHGHS